MAALSATNAPKPKATTPPQKASPKVNPAAKAMPRARPPAIAVADTARVAGPGEPAAKTKVATLVIAASNVGSVIIPPQRRRQVSRVVRIFNAAAPNNAAKTNSKPRFIR